MLTIVIYDYDAAPDAEDYYYVAKRIRVDSLEEAKRFARECVKESFYVGAKVINQEKEILYSLGLTLERN